MPNSTDVKPITAAQQKYLLSINNAMLAAQQHMNEFIAYLRDEHNAPEREWIIRDASIGFERAPAPPGAR
jgi:hypothetical protein